MPDKAPAERAPVHSMTGFARVSGPAREAPGAAAWTLTLKGVNHRFLDMAMRLPAGMEPLEAELRRQLRGAVARGHLEVTLSVARMPAGAEGAVRVRINRVLAASYFEAMRELAQEHGLTGELDVKLLAGIPGVFAVDDAGAHAAESARGEGLVEEEVLEALPELLRRFEEMRMAEGAALARELTEIMERVSGGVEFVEGLHQKLQSAHFGKLQARITAMLGGKVDRERLLTEAAILAERSDVVEEIARLRAHVTHFRTMLAGGGEVGKKLDFLLQEMNREANTLLSKMAGTGGDGLQVTEQGLAMKAEIERAREQVQNLE